MPTIEAQPSIHVLTNATGPLGYSQTPAEAVDLDGYAEFHATMTVANWSGTGSMNYKMAHAPRNRDADYAGLWSVAGITGNTTTSTYIKEYSRFNRSKWEAGGGTAEADVEVLIVPKKR